MFRCRGRWCFEFFEGGEGKDYVQSWAVPVMAGVDFVSWVDEGEGKRNYL